jgi:hypothetical protein
VWSTNGVEGVHRFLARAWRLFEGGTSAEAPTAEQLRQLHSTIKRVRPRAVTPGRSVCCPRVPGCTWQAACIVGCFNCTSVLVDMSVW